MTGDYALGGEILNNLTPFSSAFLHGVPGNRQYGEDDDYDNRLFKVLADEGNVSEIVASQGHEPDPPDSAKDVKGSKTDITHLSHSSHEGGKGSNDRNETGQDDRFSPMLCVKLLCSDQMGLSKEEGVFAIEDLGPCFVAKVIPNRISCDRGDREQNVELDDIQDSSACYKTSDKEKRVPRKEKADQKTGFSKDDSKENRITKPTPGAKHHLQLIGV